MQRFANPRLFLSMSGAVLPWLKPATLIAFLAGLYLSLVVAPADYQQGDTVRIMFFHVPVASLSMAIYASMAGASLVAWIWGHRVADLFAKAAAPIGLLYTGLALFSGAFWGKPMWGTWWVWDARITSETVLFFLYLGYIAVWDMMDDPARAAKAARIVALVGAVNLPIIKFSVDWWTTLHQPASLMKLDGPSIHASMLWPLGVMWLAFGLFFITVALIRTRTEIFRLKAHMRAMRLVEAS